MTLKPTYIAATAPEIEHYVTQGWTQENGYLSKNFTFKGFKSAWGFMQSVAEDAMRLQRQLHGKAIFCYKSLKVNFRSS